MAALLYVRNGACRYHTCVIFFIIHRNGEGPLTSLLRLVPQYVLEEECKQSL